MNTEDRFDDQIRARLREAAPREAPARLLEDTMTRISDTPQRGRGWLGGTTGRLLAAAAVLLVAVVAGAQLASVIERPPDVGSSASPQPATPVEVPSATPSGSAAPSASVAPSATPQSGVNGMLLRLVAGGGGPSHPSQTIPWFTLMDDGTVIWQAEPPPGESGRLLVRQLTPDGLAAMQEQIFAGDLLSASATYELEALPGAEPPGRGAVVYRFTSGVSGSPVVVTSVQWLGDEDEATYYQPSPEREQLDALARQLRDPESLVDGDAWEGPAEAYVGDEYQLVLAPHRDVPPFDKLDAADVPWGLDEPLDEFGEPMEGPNEPQSRCGVVSREDATAIVEALVNAGETEAHLDGPTSASLDWAAGNGIVDVAMLPLMPDGYPTCDEQVSL
jgi:hypothetical protein